MNINRKLTKRLFIIVILLGFFNNTYSQEKDIWSGKYIIKSSESIAIDSINIEKIADLKKDDVAARFESDLKRWKITSKSDNYEDEVVVRRFILLKQVSLEYDYITDYLN